MRAVDALIVVLGVCFIQLAIWQGVGQYDVGLFRASQSQSTGNATDVNATSPLHQMLSLDDHMWENQPGRNITSCVIVRTWQGHARTLGATLANLASAAHGDMTIYVIDTGQNAFDSMSKIVLTFNSLVGFELAQVSKWTSHTARQIFPAIGDLKDYGYISTDLVIDEIIQRNARAQSVGERKPCMTIHVTNGDNIVAKTFYLHTLNAVANGHNIVATNFMHKGSDFGLKGVSLQSDREMMLSTACGGWRPGLDKEIFTQFRQRYVRV
jgi:hypothetical protein